MNKIIGMLILNDLATSLFNMVVIMTASNLTLLTNVYVISNARENLLKMPN